MDRFEHKPFRNFLLKVVSTCKFLWIDLSMRSLKINFLLKVCSAYKFPCIRSLFSTFRAEKLLKPRPQLHVCHWHSGLTSSIFSLEKLTSDVGKTGVCRHHEGTIEGPWNPSNHHGKGGFRGVGRLRGQGPPRTKRDRAKVSFGLPPLAIKETKSTGIFTFFLCLGYYLLSCTDFLPSFVFRLFYFIQCREIFPFHVVLWVVPCVLLGACKICCVITIRILLFQRLEMIVRILHTSLICRQVKLMSTHDEDSRSLQI